MYAVMGWLEREEWPQIFFEVSIPRGLIRGRVDVAAASKGFRTSVAIEVKAAYVPDDPEGQLFDARRAAELVYLAAPRSVISQTEIPAGVGILEATLDVAPVGLTVVRAAKRGRPNFQTRKEFLHALMRSASRRGRFDSSWTVGKVCPACSSGRCPFWNAPRGDGLEVDEPVDFR
jgi:hypothetical protein